MTLTELRTLVKNPVFQIVFFVFVLLAFFVPKQALYCDNACFRYWCITLSSHGISYAYNIDGSMAFNYPPLICYPLYVFGKLAGNEQTINEYFYLSKLFPLFFDFVAALLVVKLVGDEKRKVLFTLLLVANPAFIYNSYCWGQYDGIFSALIFIAVYFLLNRRLVWASVFVVLAVNFKPQALIFMPPLFLLGTYMMWGRTSLKKILQAGAAMATTQIIILLPFILAGKTGLAINTVLHTVDYYPTLAPSASNFWYLLLGESVRSSSDQGRWLGLTYKNWGLLLFFVSSFLALFPLFSAVVLTVFKGRQIEISGTIIFIAFGLIPMLFYFFCTQMHSRYEHAALIYVALFSFTQKKYFPFLLLCLGYFTSLEAEMHFFNFPNYKVLFFSPYFFATVYSVVIAMLFYYLCRFYLPIFKKQIYARQTT